MNKRLLALSISALACFSLAACNLTAKNAKNNFSDTGNALALTSTDELISFNLANPNIILSTLKITGISAGETLVGMDYRPSNGKLYGLTKLAIYIIDPKSGIASGRVLLQSSLTGTSFGVDFNPVVDRLRVVDDLENSLVVNVETGSVTIQANIGTPNAPDTNFKITAAAYTNSISKPISTRLYDLDTELNRLFVQNAAATDSSLSSPVNLGVVAEDANGFDIDGTNNQGYAVLRVAGKVGLYKIDLTITDNAASAVGDLGSGTLSIKGFSIKPKVTAAYALTSDNKLLPFDPTLPSEASTADALNISGLNANETILGIDFRPKDGKLYGITSAARLVTINTTTGAATIGKSLGLNLPTSAAYNVDFNPFADRLRVISTTGLNLRIDVDMGITNIDGMLNTADPQLNGFKIGASAYTNNFSGTAGTQLFNIDLTNAALALQVPPNDGTQVSQGILQSVGANAAFNRATLDITGGANGLPLLSIATGTGASNLFTFAIPTVAAPTVALTPYPSASNQLGGASTPIQIKDIALTFE